MRQRADDDRRQQSKRLAVGLGLEKSDDRQLGLLQSERVRVIAEQRAQGQSLRSIFHGPPRFPASSAVASRPKIDRLGRADSIVYTIIVEMTRRARARRPRRRR